MAEEEEEIPVKRHPRIRVQKQEQIAYHIYLSGHISSPENFIDEIFLLQTAQEGVRIFIHINSSGGYVDSGLQLINAIRSSNARVITSLESDASSMAALVFLSGHELMVHGNATMMLHNYSGGVVGKSHEMASRVEADGKHFTQLLREICVPFVSEKELKKIIDGADMYLDVEEIRKRIDKMVKKSSSPQV